MELLAKNIRFNLFSLAVIAFVTAFTAYEVSHVGFVNSSLNKKRTFISCGVGALNSTYVSSHPTFSTLQTGSRQNQITHQASQRKSKDKNNCSHQSVAQTSIWISNDKKEKAHSC